MISLDSGDRVDTADPRMLARFVFGRDSRLTIGTRSKGAFLGEAFPIGMGTNYVYQVYVEKIHVADTCVRRHGKDEMYEKERIQ